jgi:tetratricopeptide (TPR) repeat protein
VRPRHGVKWRIGIAVAVVAGPLLYLGFSKATTVVYTARLPPLPDLSHQTSAVRAHLTGADRNARARPTSAAEVGALCRAYHADMFYDEAERCYAAAEASSASAWRWTYYRALAQDARGDAEALVKQLRRVTLKAPEIPQAWWRLGEAEFKAGRYDSAGDAWRRAVALPDPTRPPAEAGSPVRAVGAPISAYAALGLARLALLQGNADGARELLERVTTKAPAFGPAFRLLGSAYAALGREDDAKRSVRMADRSPGYDPYVDPLIDPLVRESRSSTFLLQQAASADLTTNAAWREYLIRRALEFDPENMDAVYELASMLRVLRRYGEALELFERHQRAAPDDFQTLVDIGSCLSGLQRYAEAESVLRRALEGQDDAATRYDLGFALDRAGRLTEAIAEYQRALDRNPNHKDALNNLGVGLARQGRFPQAAAQFERLVAADPDNADAHTNLGAMLLAEGARDRAAREFRAALELNPAHALAREGLQKIGGR